MKQETTFPEDGNVKLTIVAAKSVKMPVYLRYPSWTKNVAVKVNGKKVNIKQTPSSYITLERIWKNGDMVEVNYPMDLYLAEANDNPNKAAVMYGPLVLAGAMGAEGMKTPAPFSNPELYNDYYTYDYNVPNSIKTALQLDRKNVSNTIKPITGEKLVFEVANDNIRLKPINKIHQQRYVVYWDLK